MSAMQQHLVQVAFIAPFIDALDNCGVRTNGLLHKSGLGRFRLDDLDLLIPAGCVFSFFHLVARHETGEELPHEVLKNYRLENMGDWGKAIAANPDVLTALRAASEPHARNVSFERLRLGIDGQRSTFTDVFDIEDPLAKSWVEALMLALTINGLSHAGGANWRPDCATIGIEAAKVVAPLFERGTLIDHPGGGFEITFPSEFLAQPMRTIDGKFSAAYSPIAETAAGRCSQALDAMKCGEPPSLKAIAASFGCSLRTLQRRLCEEGTSFFEVADQWRMKRALCLIPQSDLTVREIAESLGYNHHTHFSRAFRRWTGLSPQAYRENPN